MINILGNYRQTLFLLAWTVEEEEDGRKGWECFWKEGRSGGKRKERKIENMAVHL